MVFRQLCVGHWIGGLWGARKPFFQENWMQCTGSLAQMTSCRFHAFICCGGALSSGSLSSADPPVEFGIFVDDLAMPALEVAWCCAGIIDCRQSWCSNCSSIARITASDPSLSSGGLVGASRQELVQSTGLHVSWIGFWLPSIGGMELPVVGFSFCSDQFIETKSPSSLTAEGRSLWSMDNCL